MSHAINLNLGLHIFTNWYILFFTGWANTFLVTVKASSQEANSQQWNWVNTFLATVEACSQEANSQKWNWANTFLVTVKPFTHIHYQNFPTIFFNSRDETCKHRDQFIICKTVSLHYRKQSFSHLLLNWIYIVTLWPFRNDTSLTTHCQNYKNLCMSNVYTLNIYWNWSDKNM